MQSLEEKLTYLVEEKQKEYTIDNIIGRSPPMREVFKLIGSVADTRTNILIRVESGTGKELVAKAIHYNSPYSHEPFIVINCSAISDTLLESELFGHVKGSLHGCGLRDQRKIRDIWEGHAFSRRDRGDIREPAIQTLARHRNQGFYEGGRKRF